MTKDLATLVPNPIRMNLYKRGNGVALYWRNVIPIQMNLYKRGIHGFFKCVF